MVLLRIRSLLLLLMCTSSQYRHHALTLYLFITLLIATGLNQRLTQTTTTRANQHAPPADHRRGSDRAGQHDGTPTGQGSHWR